ncbi:MAG: hypothetical protein JXR76_28795 [Deltaproteobacteria bacterium]|nr:hypothetical protein [Deltaproteobacteria bacterium]
MIKTGMIFVFCFGLATGGCELRELVGDFENTDANDSGHSSTEAVVTDDTENGSESVTQSDTVVGSDETTTETDNNVQYLDIETLPVEMDICNARVFSGVTLNPRPGEQYNPLLSNQDMAGYTFVGSLGFGISPYGIDDPETYVDADIIALKPLVANATDELVYGVSGIEQDGEHTEYVHAISMEDGSVRWSMPFPKRIHHDSGEFEQEARVASHPDGGVILISAFIGELILDEGKPSETLLETSELSPGTYMAHYALDGALISARALEMNIQPYDMQVIQKDGENVMLVAGNDWSKMGQPSGVAMLSMNGDLIWETSNVFEFDENMPWGMNSRMEPKRIVSGLAGTFYMALSVWNSEVFQGTDGVVIRTAQPGYFKETTDGAIGDTHGIAIAQYDMDGHLLMAALPKVGPYDMDAYPPAVIYQNDLLLIMGKQQTDNLNLTGTYTDPEEITGIADMRAVIAAYDPENMELVGVTVLPESMHPGTLQRRDDVSDSVMAYARFSDSLFFDESVAQYPDQLVNQIHYDADEEGEGNYMGMVMEICNITLK